MSALVDALEGVPRRGRPRWIAGGVGVAAAALALLAARGGGAVCGNGRVESGEECDDGNRVDTDGCRNGCRLSRCGDGVVRATVEECDDGNDVLGDGCGACLRCARGESSFVWQANGHCYSLHAPPLPWPDARRACEQQGGTLATFTSTYEQRAVHTGFLRRAGGAAWIGLETSRGSPQWVTGESMQRSDWAAGEPRVAAGACGFGAATPELHPNGSHHSGIEWSLGPCDRPLPYVCEQTGWSVRPSDGHAYRIFYTPARWGEARHACAGRGAHLATIGDAEEQAFVAAQPAIDFWIGATDEAEEGVYRWVTGEPMRFSRFGPGEPDAQRPTDDYVLFGADDLWHDRTGWRGHAYMCEAA